MTQRTVFITGASSGLGQGLAVYYAGQGKKVFAAARRIDRLKEMAGQIAGAGRIVPLEVDVQDSEKLVAAIHRAEEESGGALDLVIANAGIGRPTPAAALDWTWVKKIFDVNTTAAAVTLAAAAPAMVKADRGHLVGVGSLAGLRGLPGNAAYSASKAGLHVFLEALRIDLRGTGVAVTAVQPGFVKTELTAKNKFKMPFLMELDDAVEAITKGIAKRSAVVAFPAALAAVMRSASALPDPLFDLIASKAGKRAK